MCLLLLLAGQFVLSLFNGIFDFDVDGVFYVFVRHGNIHGEVEVVQKGNQGTHINALGCVFVT